MKKKIIKQSLKETTSMLLEEPITLSIDPFNFIDTSRSGITKNFFFKLVEKFNYTLKEIAHILNVSERTLHRYEDHSKLSKDASERALHFIRLYNKGDAVFGTMDAFNKWMKTPSLVFNKNTPMSYLDTTFGFEMLEDELGRIEHGIFA